MPTYKDEKRGTWYCSFYYTDWTGFKKKKKKEGFKKQSDAKAFERDFLSKQKNNCDMIFKNLVELYMEDSKTRVRATTFNTKKYLIDLKILPYFENMNVSNITSNHIRKWQNALKEKEYSQTYLRTINNQLTAIFNFAIKYYGLNNNPSLKAGSMGKKNADSMKFWTLNEFKQFIKCDTNARSTLAFKILFWTGIRIGELLALTFKDIDLEKRTLNIDKSYSRLNKKDIISAPKTPKSKRVVTLPVELCNDIQDYIDSLYSYNDTNRIFEFLKQSLCLKLQRVCKKSGVKVIRLHDLRHSHASLLIELGFTPLLVSERLGHEKIQTTLDTYSHLYPNKDKTVANKLDDLY